MSETQETAKLYHNPGEVGYWSGKDAYNRDINLKDGSILKQVIPMRIREENGILEMVLSTFEGNVFEPIDNFPGLKVVKGDSKNHPHETDGELLIEIHYFKIDEMEDEPRRIRPTGIKFGILGDTKKASAAKGGHRAMGENADYYLEGEDTQYDPGESRHDGLRFFPFWRIGVWGDPKEMAIRYLPVPPPEK